LQDLANLFHDVYEYPPNGGIISEEDEIKTMNRQSMIELLARFSDSDCADACDRIYALRSLCKDFIPVDYGISAEELYYLLACAEAVRSPLLVLSCVGAFGTTAASWVPDWRLPMRYYPFDSSFNSSLGESQEEELVRISGSVLAFEATYLGTVDTVNSSTLCSQSSGDFLFKSRLFFANHFNTTMEDQDSDMDRVLMNVLTEGTFDRVHVRSVPLNSTLHIRITQGKLEVDDECHEFRKRIQASRSRIAKTRKEKGLLPEDDYSQWLQTLQVSELSSALTQKTRGRTCFFTKARQFGLGPQWIRSGDVLVTMKGSKTIIALRPLKVSKGLDQSESITEKFNGQRMKVVGDCHVLGLVGASRLDNKNRLCTYHIGH
jgi:hypothetical protein